MATASITNILLIEDHPADQKFIKFCLEEHSFRHNLYLTESLAEGIELVRDKPIDIVLLDLSLTDSIGYQTVPNFKKAVSEVPLVVLTGNKNPLISLQSVRAGAQDYLVKGDFDARRLIAVIRFAIARFKQEKEKEQEIKKLRKRTTDDEVLRALVQAGDWQMDIVDLTMTWSDAVYDILGRKSRINPTRSDFLSAIYKEDRAKVEAFLDEVSRVDTAKHVSCRLLVENRIIKHVAISAIMNFDESQNKLILFGTLQVQSDGDMDVSELPEPRSLVSKTSRKDDTALSRLSFDLRTPLTSMAQLLYLLEQTELHGEQTDLISGMKAATDEFNLIVNQLLNYVLLQDTGPQESASSSFALPEMFEAIQRLADFQADRDNIDLDFKISPSLPARVTGNQKHVSQFFYNLIIRILTLRNANKELRVQIEGVTSGEEFLLRMLLSYKGQPYQWPKETSFRNENLQERPHTELLDGVIAKIARQLGIKHRISKDRTENVQLTIELPLKVATVAGSEMPSLPRAPLHLLLVEDHPLQRLAIQQVLKSWSQLVSVKVVENGQEAIELAENEQFDLILMDLKLPVLDGLEAAKILRAKDYRGPMIALTAGVSAQEEKETQQAGMNEYMLKPFQPEDLYRSIMRLLRQSGHPAAS